MNGPRSERRVGGGSRRQFLFLLGGASLSLPLFAAGGCSPEEAEPPPTSDNKPRDQGTDETVPAGQPASELGQRPEQAGGPKPTSQAKKEPLPRLDESDSMAQALGYKHDASRVDVEQFPSRAGPEGANESCRNCVHFQGQRDVTWAPCTIFPGHLVNANGWCSAWAAG
ncbi:MAG TPA: high-potential iron-sulfur protein [Woeseiaceae bacterium]|nr:high-potential iron-sulfur protein [Woeseiaceae bacterium]